jgi:hypothetical protein
MIDDNEIVVTISVSDQTIKISTKVDHKILGPSAMWELRDDRLRKTLKIMGWTPPKIELTLDECKEQLKEVYPLLKSNKDA